MATHQQRPMSDVQPGPVTRPMSTHLELAARAGQLRPSSEMLPGQYKSPEAEAIDRWFEDLSYYERTLEQMAKAKLDDNFREELKAIEQWFSVLTEPERTTALYSLLRHTTQVQIRFFITVLQQLAQKDPVNTSPGHKGQHGAPISASTTPKSAHLEMEKNGEDMGPIMGIGRQTRRLYDRHSAPQPDEKYHGTHGYAPAYNPVPEGGYESEEYYHMTGTKSNRNSVHSPLIRPKTPADDAIGSANWSVTGVPSLNLPVAGAPGMANMTSPRLPVHEDLSVPDNMGLRVGNYTRRPGSVSPIIVTPSTPMTPGAGPLSPSVHAAAAAAAAAIQHAHGYGVQNPSFQQHPASGWGHVRLAPGAGGGLAPGALSPGGGLRSPGSHSDYSDYDENYADTSSAGTGAPGRPRNGPSHGGAHKEKGKIPEAIDLEALKDIPGWLRSLRLHKYTPVFESMDWRTMIKLTDEELNTKGVQALGARRKMLKVFELVRKELDGKGVPY